jgi:hypothetical protein
MEEMLNGEIKRKDTKKNRSLHRDSESLPLIS